MSDIRKLLMVDKLFREVNAERDEWLNKGLETGGYIFGKLYPNGLAYATQVVLGGPKAKRTPVSFTADNEYANEVKERLQKEDPEIRLLGEFHVHPWKGEPHLSQGDIHQLMEVKEQRPWFVVLLGTADEWRLFDLEVGQAHSRLNALKQRETRIKDVPFQVIKCEVGDPNKILARILNVTKHELLAKKTILIVGLGSGGSTLAKYLGCTGIGRMILVDSENLETVNIIRHEGGINDIGKPKTQVCKQVIESHNPFTIVEAHSFDVVKEFDRLEELALQSDLIIGSSGSNKVNNLLNKISIERRIPAIYGGVYEKALGGYVLAVKPFETACYNCLFNLTSRSYFVEREAAESYGLNEEELHEQQGLWIDISFPALILAKIALAMLEGKQMDYNLVLYDSSLEIRKLKVARRDDCAACNQEEWIRRKQAKKKKVSLKERIRRLIKWKA